MSDLSCDFPQHKIRTHRTDPTMSDSQAHASPPGDDSAEIEINGESITAKMVEYAPPSSVPRSSRATEWSASTMWEKIIGDPA
jgi:hypothetical protein